MLSEKTIRAWKDVEYRLSLSDAERAQLPEHPAGLVEMTEKELSPVGGGGAAGFGGGVFRGPALSWSWAICC
jgi:mersacidin/lichenicidin family type 2 lantibiotic